MGNNNGWISLHRQFLDWEWYDDHNTCRLFIYCLLKANHKDNKYRGDTIKRGTFYTSLQHLSHGTGLTVKQIRTSLDKLEKTQEVVTKRAHKGTQITICKYDTYQDNVSGEGTPKGIQRADEGQSKGTPRATNNNVNTVNNANNDNKIDYPEWLDLETYNEYKEMRIEMKKPMTELAEKKIIKRLDKFGVKDHVQILENAIIGGWSGVFEIKDKGNNTNVGRSEAENPFDPKVMAREEQHRQELAEKDAQGQL